MTLHLQRRFFTEKEHMLIEHGDFCVSLFRYGSDVEAVRVKNSKGEFIWLPFKGQQVWRMSFCGRDLTMKSMFDEPAASDDFGAGYGCFMLHCGMTAMGNPAPDDTHPQHGELPNAAYDFAYISIDTDAGGNYIEAGGVFDYKRAFETHYTASPKIRLYESGTVLDISMTVENKRSDPMEYLYLCHVNFRPLEGAELVYDANCMRIHKDIPASLSAEKAKALRDYMEALSENPWIQNVIDARTQIYEPEIVFTFNYKADESGWAKCMQTAPDGSADFVACRLRELPVGIRWIARTPHEDAMGMLLPSTAEHLGYNYCKKNRQIKYLGANESITFAVKAGVLET
ncbi:MAG: DUF4432 family protein [Firmicutes bacterium]|nr:DUF4432 family protein [Bacillota bacterium]